MESFEKLGDKVDTLKMWMIGKTTLYLLLAGVVLAKIFKVI